MLPRSREMAVMAPLFTVTAAGTGRAERRCVRRSAAAGGCATNRLDAFPSGRRHQRIDRLPMARPCFPVPTGAIAKSVCGIRPRAGSWPVCQEMSRYAHGPLRE